MQSLISSLTTAFDLALVLLGFTVIIVVHELGHYVAARWAGVRVLAFAVGFGNALVSYRRGLGFRRGSSEAEYKRLGSIDPGASAGISTCEWRLNSIPFGGYVKMLGQDDADPGARSDEPDSFQRAPVWKRMVIISAGVVCNVVLAAMIFVVVFTAGLKTEPAMIGRVAPGSPAATTIARNAAEFGVTEPGLRAQDRVLGVDGRLPSSFSDFAVKIMMARKDRSVRLDVQRPGVGGMLVFDITPTPDPTSKFLSIGAEPGASTSLRRDLSDEPNRSAFANRVGDPALAALATGRMRLSSVEGSPAISPYDLERAVQSSGGKPVHAEFESGETGATNRVVIRPLPLLNETLFSIDADRAPVASGHLLGLIPALRVESTDARGQKAGLLMGDVFVQVGASEWPSVPAAIREIRASKALGILGAGRDIRLAVLRTPAAGSPVEVDLGLVPVSRQGTIGFVPGDTSESSTLLAAWPTLSKDPPPSGARLKVPPGSRVLSVAGTPTANFAEIRAALELATRPALETGVDPTVELLIQLPITSKTGEAPRTETLAWTIPIEEVRSLHSLGWASPIPIGVFEPEQTILRAKGPLDALAMGINETHRVMMTTYLTFARLFQGTVKVEHLKGPVGIAHTGTLIADKGFVWLLFFLGLISINLAVINFMPIPITDGGHMLFLAYEQVMGRPPPPAVFNAATLAGLALVGVLFVIVTFNDLVNLFTG